MYKSIKLQGIINFDSNLTNRGKIDMKDLKDIWGSRFNVDSSRKLNLIYKIKPKSNAVFIITMISLTLGAMGLLAAFK